MATVKKTYTLKKDWRMARELAELIAADVPWLPVGETLKDTAEEYETVLRLNGTDSGYSLYSYRHQGYQLQGTGMYIHLRRFNAEAAKQVVGSASAIWEDAPRGGNTISVSVYKIDDSVALISMEDVMRRQTSLFCGTCASQYDGVLRLFCSAEGYTTENVGFGKGQITDNNGKNPINFTLSQNPPEACTGLNTTEAEDNAVVLLPTYPVTNEQFLGLPRYGADRQMMRVNAAGIAVQRDTVYQWGGKDFLTLNTQLALELE